jgi:hypothetical protein
VISDTHVLSEAFDEVLKGRRVLSAVFATFEYDPVFFEQEILPVLFDANLSHIHAVRSAQLQLSLIKLQGQVVVFYDPAGLKPGSESPKLDIRSVPVRWRKGLFHPKNVFLLVEEDSDEGPRRSVIVACLSANLTRSGWWTNVECCHIEEVGEGDFTSLRDPLLALLSFLQGQTQSEDAKRGVRDLSTHLRKAEQRATRTQDGKLFTQFFDSTAQESFPDFLERAAPRLLQGCNLEIISPFFDQSDTSQPISELIRRFGLDEVRIALPENHQGEVALTKGFYEGVDGMENVFWGTLPGAVTNAGDQDARNVHAKVYRFFKGTSEYVFVGSPNCTRPGHTGANYETGFLVEVPGGRRREFWLEKRRGPLPSFAEKVEGEPAASEAATSLQVRYRWDTQQAEARWDERKPSPSLELQDMQGVKVCTLAPLSPAEWHALDEPSTQQLRESLRRSAFLKVIGEKPDSVCLLVQQEGMSHAPSLVLSLTVSEILEFWARATEDQRRALLEQRILEKHPELANDLVMASRARGHVATFFDRFAGYFQAFNGLEARVRNAKQKNQLRDAIYALFSKQYDSLRTTLERVTSTSETMDPIDRYVLLLTAEQTLKTLEAEWPELFEQHRADSKELDELVQKKALVRSELGAADATIEPFLTWFEQHFLKRVAPREESAP